MPKKSESIWNKFWFNPVIRFITVPFRWVARLWGKVTGEARREKERFEEIEKELGYVKIDLAQINKEKHVLKELESTGITTAQLTPFHKLLMERTKEIEKRVTALEASQKALSSAQYRKF